MIPSLLKRFNIPRKFEGESIRREEKCRMCGSMDATKIGETDFWDLHRANLVQCKNCQNIQLDPMLSSASTAIGCYAYHLNELTRIKPGSQKRNLIRNFRRGVLFGQQLKNLGKNPNQILEFGPGSGYFAAGIQFIFPYAKVTVVDIVDDVLEKNFEVHGFEGLKGMPEEIEPSKLNRKFDLIIARDVIEHVADVGLMIRNVSDLLMDEGMFHFITPNGHEDVWGHYLRWKYGHGISELLINHVNYFDGKGLQKLLESNGLQPVRYYTYGFKWTRRGKGWSLNQKRYQKESERYSAKLEIESKESKINDINFSKKEVLKAWYINPKRKFITVIVSWYHHRQILRSKPSHNLGHELFGLFQKAKKG